MWESHVRYRLKIQRFFVYSRHKAPLWNWLTTKNRIAGIDQIGEQRRTTKTEDRRCEMDNGPPNHQKEFVSHSFDLFMTQSIQRWKEQGGHVLYSWPQVPIHYFTKTSGQSWAQGVFVSGAVGFRQGASCLCPRVISTLIGIYRQRSLTKSLGY